MCNFCTDDLCGIVKWFFICVIIHTMLNKIVFDVETQKDFNEVGGRNKHHLLQISVAVAYSYARDEYLVFEENEAHKLGELLESADQVIGFNIREFDYEVLSAYGQFRLDAVPTLDLLEKVEQALGHRVGLDAIAQATLGAAKTGSGLDAIHLWRQRRVDELIQYCKKDVELTKRLYEYGRTHKKLLYKDFFDVREIPVEFPEPSPRQNVKQQKSLF